jgi:DNA-directed RNA polymerase specialized sigma24 family protein
MPDWSPTQENFNRLLSWLDPNRDRAGQRYERIRRKLILVFASRGFAFAEEMTDESINRVMKKLPEIEQQYTGSPENYFFGVAKIIALEWPRKDHPIEIPQPADGVSPASEEPLDCLDRCLDRLPSSTRELVLEYYQQEKRAKIDQRTALAQRLGIAANALRIRAHRIRKHLEKCVLECLGKKALALRPQ